jgi:hypothetical protein
MDFPPTHLLERIRSIINFFFFFKKKKNVNHMNIKLMDIGPIKVGWDFSFSF